MNGMWRGILLLSLISSLNCFSDLNVGTVLFKIEDLGMECWSPSKVMLLKCRMILEDLMPITSMVSVMDDETIKYLVHYVKLIRSTIDKELVNDQRVVVLKAFLDTLGGYLRHFLLPHAKYSYYVGNIRYRSIEKIVTLYRETKDFLRTNGRGWAEATMDTGCKYEPRSFTLDNLQKFPITTCDDLVLFTPRGTDKFSNGVEVCIPIPYFDKLREPQVLALPLKMYPLRGTKAAWGADAVLDFYIKGYSCLKLHNNTNAMKFFLNGVYSWIIDEVLPLMDEEEIYTVLGGVLQIFMYIKGLGCATKMNLWDLRKRYTQMDYYHPNTIVFWRQWDRRTLLAALLLLFIIFACIFALCLNTSKYLREEKKEEKPGLMSCLKRKMFFCWKRDNNSNKPQSKKCISKSLFCFDAKEETKVEMFSNSNDLMTELQQDKNNRPLRSLGHLFGDDSQTSTTDTTTDDESDHEMSTETSFSR